MKYLHSAMQSSAKPLMDPKNVHILKWAGVVFYTTTIFILFLIDICTYPGDPTTGPEFQVYIAWKLGTQKKNLLATRIIWLILNIFATVITVYAIFVL